MENISRQTVRAARRSFLSALILSLGKLAAGLAGHSWAMISDAAHSAAQALGSLADVVGMRLSAGESDKEHPYGHERMACAAAFVLSGILLAVGLAVGWENVQRILPGGREAETPGLPAAAAALGAILEKELLLRIGRAPSGGSEVRRPRSDALPSVAALAGILGARAGFPALDPLAGAAICGAIVKSALDAFRDAAEKTADHSCGADTEDAIRLCAVQLPELERIDLLRTREFGSRICVELEIAMDGALPLRLAHAAAEKLQDDIRRSVPGVKHIMIHVNPAE